MRHFRERPVIRTADGCGASVDQFRSVFQSRSVARKKARDVDIRDMAEVVSRSGFPVPFIHS